MSATPDFSTAGPGLIEETLAERAGANTGTQLVGYKLECNNVKDLNAE